MSNTNVWVVEAKYEKRKTVKKRFDDDGKVKNVKEWQERATKFKMTNIGDNPLLGRSCTNQ